MKLAKHRMDAAAITLSAACAVHCLILPVAASALPLLGSLADADWVHWLFLAMAAPMTLIAVRHNTPRGLQFLAAIGLLGLLLGALRLPNPAWDTPLTVSAAVILTLTHLFNVMRRMQRP